MRKYLHPTYLPILVPVASVLGLVLRLWTLGGGPDEAGLYAPQPLAWVLLWLVTALTLAGIYLLTRRLKNAGRYFDNFPRSVLGAAGCAAAALGVMYVSVTAFASAADLLDTLTGLLGILSAAALLLTALARYQGKKCHFGLHALPCLYFALRIFACCKHWSNLTQTGTFLFQFLASVCVMLAAYQLCCFDVNLGDRRSSLLWSLAGVYFCVLALPMGEDTVFYAGMLLWLLTNLCATRPLKSSKPQPEPIPEEEAETAAENTAPEAEQSAADDLLSWPEKE